jgi:hypothetical protein
MNTRLVAAVVFVLSIMLSNLTFAEFRIESVDVIFYNIQKDGSVSVRESIKFFVIGDYEQQLYKSGFGKNELAFWSKATGLKEVKLHVNQNAGDIKEFRIIPQPLKKCNSFLNLCHGEIILEYIFAPYYDKTNNTLIPNTGIFKIETPKPRTIRYTLNQKALAFATTENGDSRLEKYETLTIELPKNSVVYKINPEPEGYNKETKVLRWSDTMLVRFSLVFDVEESISNEVTEFFSRLAVTVKNALEGPHGTATIIIAVVLLSAYLYLKSVRPKKT